jgi:hypothetical protein
MCNDAEPSAVSKLADFASFTLENFCGDLTEKAQKDGSRIELSPALIELMGMALYWIWVFDHFINLEDIVKSVQARQRPGLRLIQIKPPGQLAMLKKVILRWEDSTNCAAVAMTPDFHPFGARVWG